MYISCYWQYAVSTFSMITDINLLAVYHPFRLDIIGCFAQLKVNLREKNVHGDLVMKDIIVKTQMQIPIITSWM